MAHLTSICGGSVPIVRDLIITHPDIDHSSGAHVILEVSARRGPPTRTDDGG
jgi:glyoxylase-like metal-dependent hydrolase (beta-lactamase superfamily II)